MRVPEALLESFVGLAAASAGKTGLRAAASRAAIAGLTAVGLPSRLRDRYGNTALYHAVDANRPPETLSALVAAGVPANAREGKHETPLHRAARNNASPAVFEVLLRAGADAGATRWGSVTPLHHAAAYCSDPAVIGTLLAAGAEVNAKSQEGSPLHRAAGKNPNPAIIEALLAAGAKVNAKNWSGTPLHRAAADNPNTAVIETLLTAGAKVNANYRGETPLDRAAADNPNVAVIETLLAAGAEVNATGGRETPLHRAAAHNPNVAVIEVLLAAGADIGARSEYGRNTPLHEAAVHGQNVAAIEALVAAGADLDATDSLGRTPLHRSAWSGSPEVIEALVAAGAAVNSRDCLGWTPLHTAADGNYNAGVAEILLEAGSDPAAGDRYGRTPLHLAAVIRRPPALPCSMRVIPPRKAVKNALLAAGADTGARDNADRRPFDRNSVEQEIHPPHRKYREGAADRTLAVGESQVVAIAFDAPVRVEVTNISGSVAVEPYRRRGVFRIVGRKPGRSVVHFFRGGCWGSGESADEPRYRSGVRHTLGSRFGRRPRYSFTLSFEVISPLLAAARKDPNPEVIAGLVAAGEDLRASDRRGRTLLDFAISRGGGAPGAVDALLAAGVDATWTKHKNMPLHRAARRSTRPEIIRSLVSAGAEVGARWPIVDKCNETPLHFAARHNPNPAVIEELVAAGAKVGARARHKRTPLHLAASRNPNPQVLRALANGGAKPDARDHRRRTALHLAVLRRAKPGVLAELLAEGADPNARDDDGRTALHLAVSPPPEDARFPLPDRERIRETVEILLRAGAAVDARDAGGRSPLHDAARDSRSSPSSVVGIETLAAAGAGLEDRDRHGRAPLHLAAAYGSTAPVEALLRAGADPNRRDDSGETALHALAARCDATAETVEALLDAGGRRDLRNHWGETPAERGALHRNTAVFGALRPAAALEDAAAVEEAKRWIRRHAKRLGHARAFHSKRVGACDGVIRPRALEIVRSNEPLSPEARRLLDGIACRCAGHPAVGKRFLKKVGIFERVSPPPVLPPGGPARDPIYRGKEVFYGLRSGPAARQAIRWLDRHAEHLRRQPFFAGLSFAARGPVMDPDLSTVVERWGLSDPWEGLTYRSRELLERLPRRRDGQVWPRFVRIARVYRRTSVEFSRSMAGPSSPEREAAR